MQNVKGKYLREIPFIQQMLSKNKLITIMKEVLYSPGEYIFHQDDFDDSSLFYLVKGEVEILIENQTNKQKPTIVQTLSKQNYFGEVSFITGNRRSAGVRASDFCQVYKLERQKFLEILKQNTQDYEIFCMMKESMIMKNNFSSAKVKCYSCNQSNHLVSNCPKIHFTVSNRMLALKAFKSTPHLNRKSIQRREKTFNSLNIEDICLTDAYRILNDDLFMSYNMNYTQNEGEVISNIDELISEFYNESDNIQQQLNGINNKMSQINSKRSCNHLDENKNNASYYLNDTLDCVNKNEFSNIDEAIWQDKSSQRKIQEQDQSYKCLKRSMSSSLIIENQRSTSEDQESYKKFLSEKLKKQAKLNDDSPKKQLNQDHHHLEKDCKYNNQSKYDERIILDIDYYQSDLNKSIIQQQQQQQQQYQQQQQQYTIKSNSAYNPLQKRKMNITRQVSFKNLVEDSQKNASPYSDNILSNQDLQYQQPQMKVFDLQYQSTNSHQNATHPDTQQDNSIYNNTNMTANQCAQAFFKQIRSKTIQQIKKAQMQMQTNGNQITQSSSGSRRAFSNEDQRRMTQNQESRAKTLHEENNTRRSHFDDKQRKNIKEDLMTKKQTFQTSFSNIDQKLDECLTSNKRTPSQIFFDQQLISKQPDASLFKRQLANYDTQKLIHYFKNLEWDYFQLMFFDKAKIFQHYYPHQNFNVILQQLKSIHIKRNSKKINRTILLDESKRSPIIDRYILRKEIKQNK